MTTTKKQVLFAAAVLLMANAEAAYGLKWEPGDDNAVAGAYLTAVNAFEFRMRQPDGKVRMFRRDFEQPNMLYGDEPWVGEDMGGGIVRILTNPDFKGGRTGFIFQNGHLRRMVLGRKDYQFEQMPYPASTNSLESLWPEELTKEKAVELFSTWKGDDGRLRIGYANPNKGGCLMAEIALVGLALLMFAALRRRWIVAAAGTALMLASLYVLTLTESRSAFVAFSAGAALLIGFRAKALFTWRRLAIAAVVAAVAAGIVFCSGAGERFTTGLVDAGGESDSLRVNIMKASPRMMVDAPGGWGHGISGSAYANWYQAPDEFRVVRTLVNSHLTWLVELGWCGRAMYLTGIAAFLALLLLVAKRGASPAPAALFGSLFAAGCFNSVMEAPTLWILPCASILLFLTPKSRRTFSAKGIIGSIAFGLAFAGIALGFIAYTGSRNVQVPSLFTENGKRVIINGRTASNWVADDGTVLGQAFVGRELRMFYAAFPHAAPMGIAWNIEDLPHQAKHLVVSGRLCEKFLEKCAEEPSFADGYERITFLSPSIAASSVPEELTARQGFNVAQGELAVRLTADADNPPPFLTIINGAELYIPGWMQIVTASQNDSRNFQNKKGNEK